MCEYTIIFASSLRAMNLDLNWNGISTAIACKVFMSVVFVHPVALRIAWLIVVFIFLLLLLLLLFKYDEPVSNILHIVDLYTISAFCESRLLFLRIEFFKCFVYLWIYSSGILCVYEI